MKVSTINCHDLIHFEQPALAVIVLTPTGWASDKSSLDQSWSELNQTNYITFDPQMKIALSFDLFFIPQAGKKKKDKKSFPDIFQSCKDIISA